MVQNTQTCASKASGEVGEFNLHLRLQTSFGTLRQCPLYGDLARSSRSPLLVKVMTPWRRQTKKSPIGPNVHANWSWAQRTLRAYRGRDSTDGLEWSTLRYGRSKVSLVVPCTKIDLMCPKSDNMIDPGALGFLPLHNRYTRDQWQRSHKTWLGRSWLLATIFLVVIFCLFTTRSTTHAKW